MIAILQFTDQQRPGFLETYLHRRELPYQVYRPAENGQLPDPAQCKALALMGGTMEANDSLPWIAPVLSLIVDADKQGIPLIGHCLGAQLIGRAMGAEVKDNPCYEIGWHQVELTVAARQHPCFAGLASFVPFHWHYQTVGLPAGAALLLQNRHCQQQAFQLRRMLAFQCHIEITEELVALWCQSEADTLKNEAKTRSVQPAAVMQENAAAKASSLHQISVRVYDYWLSLAD